MNEAAIEQIRPELTWRLRQKVLYPQQQYEAMAMPEDAGGIHFGAFYGDKLVAVVSLFQRGNGFRLRKFAVEPAYQKMGIGSSLLSCISAFVISQGGTMLWCNARLSAIPFYLKHNFVQTGRFLSKNGYDYEVLEKFLPK